MKRNSPNTLLGYSPVFVYALFAIFYWGYAYYQRLTLIESGTGLILAATAMLVALWLLNKNNKKFIFIWSLIALAATVIQLVIYAFLISIPTGWETFR